MKKLSVKTNEVRIEVRTMTRAGGVKRGTISHNKFRAVRRARNAMVVSGD
jgi:hypothetical protein